VTREETLQLVSRQRVTSALLDAPPGTEALRPGHLLDGRYLLQAVLDEGGTSSVWRAEHVRLGRAVAVKILRPEVAGSTADVERFRREAQIAVRLSSPHVVDVLDFGDAPGGGLYIVMELLAGESLRERLRRDERLTPARVAELLRQLLVGLDAAHRAGIVHRDLKPDNLWLVPLPDGGERLKILDFGIAKLEGPASGTKPTHGGLVVGTPEFLSPEQAVGGDVDHRADLYSAGIVAWLLATGCHPFPTHDPRTLLRAHAFDPVSSPTREIPARGAPAPCASSRATEKDRDLRAERGRAARGARRRAPRSSQTFLAHGPRPRVDGPRAARRASHPHRCAPLRPPRARRARPRRRGGGARRGRGARLGDVAATSCVAHRHRTARRR
jgi:serine/threonine-protein kinase